MLTKKISVNKRYNDKEFISFIAKNLNYKRINYYIYENKDYLEIIGIDFLYRIDFNAPFSSFKSVIKYNNIDSKTIKYDPVLVAIFMYDEFALEKEQEKRKRLEMEENRRKEMMTEEQRKLYFIRKLRK